MTDNGAGGDDLTYAVALAELKEILARLEDESLDVDALTTQVRRASTLIKFCRDRINAAGMEVEHIVADLQAAGPGGTDPAANEETPG